MSEIKFDLEKQHKSGKLHAIERLRAIAPDFVLSPPVSAEDYDGVLVGYGTVAGKKVYLYAQDFTFHGGTLGWKHGQAIAAAIAEAAEERCPIVGVCDSGGARIQEGVRALAGYGEVFRQNTLASGLIPQISVVAGPCAGGAVYSPGITDFVFVIRNMSRLFVTGPQVVESVTHEKISAEELGGANVHATQSGVATLAFDTEEECYQAVQRLLTLLPTRTAVLKKRRRRIRYAAQENPAGLLPDRPNRAYDVLAVLDCVLDQASLMELSQEFASSIVIGLGTLGGRTVGVAANQPQVRAGVLDCDASDKAARFVRFCDAFAIPILTFVDTPGYLPGLGQEAAGIIRHGAKLLYAYAEATTIRLTVEMRKAFGGAYIAMGSKHLGADRVYAWPGAQIAVMGATGAVQILYGKQLKAMPEEQRAAFLAEKEAAYEAEMMNPDMALREGYIDRILSPEDTRRVLCADLKELSRGLRRRKSRKHGNIPL